MVASGVQDGGLLPLHGCQPDDLVRFESQVFTQRNCITSDEIAETIAQAVIAYRVGRHLLLPLAEVRQNQNTSAFVLTGT